MPPSHKFDHEQSLRDEIERRTQAGETCMQIAAALNAQGFDVSSKTISRRRVEWGHRKRASPRTKGTVRPNLSRPRPPRPDTKCGSDGQPSLIGKKQSCFRKREITERTQRGETAEQICDALTARGVHIQKGASTITRLQTFWGLIPYDDARARGRGLYRAQKKAARKAANAPQPQTNDVRVPSLTVIQHYPSTCRFGPGQDGDSGLVSGSRHLSAVPENPYQRDTNDIGPDTDVETDTEIDVPDETDTDSDVESPEPLAIPEFTSIHVVEPANLPSGGLAIDLAAETARVEALMDLGNRIVPAAEELQRLIEFIRTRTGPLHGGSTMTAIAGARSKLRAAAQAIVQMTSDP